MSLLTYIQNPLHHFIPAEQSILRSWYDELDAQVPWQVIRRNFDRECERDDIDHSLFADFLREITRYYRPNQPDPLVFVTSVFAASRSRYLIPGRHLTGGDVGLSRVMRLDPLVKYNLQRAGIPVTYDLRGAVAAVSSVGGHPCGNAATASP